MKCKRKQRYEIRHGDASIELYRCDPELNNECKKEFCIHNINALEKLCDSTTQERFALDVGKQAQPKEYTPRSK